MRKVHIYISGIVQGVYFRANTTKQAKILGLTGWIKNLQDGRVELIAEGKIDKIDELIEYCKHGPEAARVESIEVEEQNPGEEFKSFDILG